MHLKESAEHSLSGCKARYLDSANGTVRAQDVPKASTI